MRYVYRKGGLRPPIPPDKAAAEINRVRALCEASGNISDLPKRLWKESRKKTAPLHKAFTWDDTVCGELWRTHQARMIIVTVCIVEEDANGEETILAPAFPNIAGTENRDRAYESIEDAIASDEMREQLLADVKQRLVALKRKYQYLKELEVVWSAIDRVA